MEKEKLSVVIIAGNEEKNIGDCLESVKWAAEIVLVDSESKDRTIEIAKNHTDKIFIHPWEGYAAQRKFALDKATNHWVLIIDADERVSEELRDEIKNILQNGTNIPGYYIPRRNYFLDKVVTSCFWYPDYQLRFFQKDKVEVINKKIHECYEVKGEGGYLKGDIIHFTHKSFFETLKKINIYSSLAAEEKVNSKKVKPHQLILYPMAAFLNHFISRKGYKDGIHGLMVSLIHAMTNMMTYMKVWELQNIKKQSVDSESFLQKNL